MPEDLSITHPSGFFSSLVQPNLLWFSILSFAFLFCDIYLCIIELPIVFEIEKLYAKAEVTQEWHGE
jgi:hypothetical protein